MRRNNLNALLALVLLLPSLAWANFPATAVVANETLRLEGQGLLRWKGLFKVYEAALYRAPGAPLYSIDGAEMARLDIRYLRDIPARGFVDATRAGFEAVLPAGETLSQWLGPLNQTLGAYQDVSAGDGYRLEVSPQGFRLLLNDRVLVDSPDSAFGRRLLGVWLLPGTPAPGLREQLLSLR